MGFTIGGRWSLKKNETRRALPLLKGAVVNFRLPPKVQDPLFQPGKTHVGFDRLEHSIPHFSRDNSGRDRPPKTSKYPQTAQPCKWTAVPAPSGKTAGKSFVSSKLRAFAPTTGSRCATNSAETLRNHSNRHGSTPGFSAIPKFAVNRRIASQRGPEVELRFQYGSRLDCRLSHPPCLAGRGKVPRPAIFLFRATFIGWRADCPLPACSRSLLPKHLSGNDYAKQTVQPSAFRRGRPAATYPNFGPPAIILARRCT